MSLVGAACASPGTGTPPAPVGAEAVELRPDPDLSALEVRIREVIAEADTAVVGVALYDLGTGLRLEINGDIVMHAASTMKVPVMLEVFRQAEQGELSLDDEIPVVNRFRSIADGSIYELTVDSDSDSTLYARIGATATVGELVRLMIVRSSNLALNLLIERVDARRVRETMAQIGAHEMRVRRGVEDLAAFRAGLNNETTAYGFAASLEAIARCSVTSRTACDEMVEILSGQEFNEMIPVGVPAGTTVAHKTGWITGIRHDGGIVFPAARAPYVLTVLTRGFVDPAAADAIGARISGLVWRYLTDPAFGAGVRVSDTATLSLLDLHATHRVGRIGQRHFGHGRLWQVLSSITSGSIRRDVVGRSGEGRAIELLRYGTGPVRVLLWSQMHGDESTATMALVDLVNFLHRSGSDARARNWAQRLTILMMPMINPDGAERFQRHDVFGVDVNRDARALETPEGRALKAVRDQWRPDFGFNLHDQNPRTRVGTSNRLAAISLLAPAPDATAAETPDFRAAKHLAATIRSAVEPLVGGFITRYDDTFNPRAFGDLMQQWGTSTVLIESGGWRADPEKQYLRSVNFVALVRALDAIAADTVDARPIAIYEQLPENGRAVVDLLIVGGTLVPPGAVAVRADIAANVQGGSGDPLRSVITEVGDLQGTIARDTIDAAGLFLHPAPDAYDRSRGLSPGAEASFVVRQGEAQDSRSVFRIERGSRRPVSDG